MRVNDAKSNIDFNKLLVYGWPVLILLSLLNLHFFYKALAVAGDASAEEGARAVSKRLD